ncbi:hypothetical protein ABK040_005359 [Willaertia magna]
MSLWRSESMVLLEMTMQREAAHYTVERLGDIGFIEFKDLSSNLNAFQRQYATEVKRCEELERIIRYFEDRIEKSGTSFASLNEPYAVTHEEEQPLEYTNILDSYELEFSNLEKELRELSESVDQLVSEQNKAEEFRHVLSLGSSFLRGDEEMSSESSQNSGHTLLSGGGGASLGYLTGVVPRDKIPTFMLLIYRSTRGNVVPRFAEIEEPLFDQRSGKAIEKNVFTIFFGALAVKEKVKKVCEAIGASIHDFPEGDISGAQRNIDQKINELETTIESSKSRMNDLLSKIAMSLPRWRERVRREKAIYFTLNLFNYNIKGSAVAVGWCAEKNVEEVRKEMEEARLAANAQVASICEVIQTTETPPTFFQTNKFTAVFQDIVNAYGVPDYKEMNPALPSIILFPFLFAVMFGDFGHGVLLSLFAIVLVAFEAKIKPIAENNELLGMIFSGRYVLVLMGIFSVYTGFLYNDGFGLGIDIFPSAYDFSNGLVGEKNPDRTYPFGIDPAWYGTVNKLLYYNSLKMKLSVIFGVAHMFIGLFMALANMIHFGHFLDIFVEWIPEVIILLFTFGYMCFLIIYKWCVNWGDKVYANVGAPSILPMMTDFFLSPWKMSQNPMFYSGGDVEAAKSRQSYAQMALLVIAVICIPILLIPKPIIEYCKQKKKFRPINDAEAVNSSEEGDDQHVAILEGEVDYHHAGGQGHEEMEPFSELFIKQLIHTIEYVLGCVSNTASYLRLWALSLAHAQLSEVFWSMTIGLVLNFLGTYPAIENAVTHSGIGLFLVFSIWFCATLGVLLIMESLSAFLHALRLTWVEFQNKFFKGTGSLFKPFSFENFGKDD